MTDPGLAPDKTRPPAVLFYPRTGVDLHGVNVLFPLSVMLPAAALGEAGIRTVVIDQRIDTDWRARVTRAVRDGCLFFGISAMTGPQIRWGLRAAELVREAAPACPIVWGGIHPSLLPDQTLADDRVDSVVVGRGEPAIVELARARLAGASLPPRTVVPQQNGRALAQPRIRYGECSWETYVTHVTDGARGLSHTTSRGCPHRCAYCYNGNLNESRWQGCSAEDVLEDLTALARLGCTGALLIEDNFFVNRKRVERVVDGLLERGLGLKIKADCRADYLLGYDDEFLDRLKRAGFEELFVGVESGSDRILELVRKDVTVAQIVRANRKLAGAGIRPHYSFMAGLPGERPEDVHDTVRLMRQLKDEHPGAVFGAIKGYVPYPGTEMYDAAVALGFDPPSSLEAWSRYDWNGSPRPWLNARHERLVEKATFVSAGLDTDLVGRSGLSHKPVLWFFYRLYAHICRKRCEKRDFGFMPELPILRLAKHVLGGA